MKRFWSFAVAATLATMSGGPIVLAETPDGAAAARSAPARLEQELIAREKQSWVAWKAHDGKFFEQFLSDDHVEIGFGGIAGKAQVVAVVGSKACVVEDYAVDHFRLTKLTPTAALLTYHAKQDTRCGGVAVPSPVWASSLYVRRGERWLNVSYQQTPAAGES